MSPLLVRAPAKINLFLRVAGRRSDGYHEILSLVQTVTLWDTLAMERARDGLRLETDDPTLSTGPDNLIARAVAALSPRLPAGWGLAVRLEKRVPAGAGLGGGSSDAAAALLGVDRLFGLGLGPVGLTTIASELGSDVPYLLTGGTALLTGRGCEVEPWSDAPPADLVVAFPGSPLSTREVYAQVQEPLTLAPDIASIRGSRRTQVDVAECVRTGNDLEPHAVRLSPVVGRLKALVTETGATVASMTGSGSAVFGLYARRSGALAAAETIRRSGFDAWPCRTLGRETLGRDRWSP